MDKEELIIKLEEFKSGLLAAATDGSFSESEYKTLREEFIKIDFIKDILPRFVKTQRSPIEFRRYMQSMFDHYAERRSYITNSMNKVITYVEEHEEISDTMDESLKIGKRIGFGGFGEVYKAHHSVLDMDFAVKLFEPVFVTNEEQKAGEKRFFREAKMLFQLHSDNIVQIYDAGYKNGCPFIRMEYIEGENLEKLIAEYSKVTFKQSCIIIQQILHGLRYAHSKRIIHRDLKPSNIMYSRVENKYKIIDFGISAFLDTEKYTKLTKTGESIAGGSYIDPQLQSNPCLRDIRSDIYSVGAIWYYLLTASVPSGADMKNRLISIAKLDEITAEIILKCMRFDLNERYSNCDEVLNIIQKYI